MYTQDGEKSTFRLGQRRRDLVNGPAGNLTLLAAAPTIPYPTRQQVEEYWIGRITRTADVISGAWSANHGLVHLAS